MLGLAPRHQEIVARILGDDHAYALTRLIGFAEIGMALWVVSGIARKVNAVTQIAIVAAMNITEYFLAPDLLLFGRANAAIAAAFIVLIYYVEFRLGERSA